MIKLLTVKGQDTFDVSELVESVRWSGRKGAAARSVTVTMLDDDTRDRAGIDVEQGHQYIFYQDDVELFRGLIMQQGQNRNKKLTTTAYDAGIYLANNKDSFNYADKSASEIFVDCCTRFQIPYLDVANTIYKIPELPKPKTTPFDAICDALSITYKATGIRYYPACKGSAMRLIKRTDNIMQWVLETGVNVSDYSFSKSIEKVKTRIRLLTKEGKVLAEAADNDLEKKIGIFQDISSPKDGMNAVQLNELARNMLDESCQPERVLTVTALGLPDVISGVGVFINIPELGISKTYYVEEDTHTFKGLYHSMTLKLVQANDIGKTTATAEIKIGDTVNFAGGNHYYTSTATEPAGGTRAAGSAKVTNIAKSAAHPYHLIAVDGGGSNVYGWVDAATVSK